MADVFSTNPLAAITVLIPLGPFAALVLIAAGGRFLAGSRGLWVACVGGAVSCVASVAAIALLLRADKSGEAEAASVELFRWLSLPGEPSSAVQFGLRLDGLSALILVAVTVALTAATAQAAMIADPRSACRSQALGIAVLATSTVMALLAPTMVQFFLFWQLATVCGWCLRDGGQLEAEHRRIYTSGSEVLRLRGTDSFFIFGLLLLWTAFGTTEFAAVLGGQSPSSSLLAAFLETNGNVGLQSHRTAVVSTICLCLLVGILGRCQQFPFFGRLRDGSHAVPATDGWEQTAVFLPLGIYLLARCLPLFSVSDEVSRLAVMLGALTAVIAPICALTERDLQRLLRYIAAAMCGWVLMGIGSGTTAGFLAAILLLVVTVFAMSALFLVADQISLDSDSTEFAALGGLKAQQRVQYWSFLLAALVLTSGLWGQNAILTELTSLTDGSSFTEAATETVDQPATSSLLGAALPGLAAASLFFVSLALFRGFLLVFHREALRENATRDGTAVSPSNAIAFVLALVAAVLGAVVASYDGEFASLLGNSAEFAESNQVPDMFFVDYGSLLSLTGAVVAWVMYAQPSEWPARIAVGLAPLTRLSENGFYLDEIGATSVVLPLRGLSYFCRFVDWLLIDRFWKSAPASLFAELQRSTRPLRTGLVQFYALSFSLASVILLAIVLWLKR